MTTSTKQGPDRAAQAETILNSALQRSAIDPVFRQQLLTDPRVALATYVGGDVSNIDESFNVRFIENRADATIVLPDFVDQLADLSEEELEAVAGGTTWPCASVILSLIASVLAVENALKDDGCGCC